MSAFNQAQRKKLVERVLGKRTTVLDTSLSKGALHWWPDYEYCKTPTSAPYFDCYKDFGRLVEDLKSDDIEIDITWCPPTAEWEVVLVKFGEPAPGRIACHPNLCIALATVALRMLEGKR